MCSRMRYKNFVQCLYIMRYLYQTKCNKELVIPSIIMVNSVHFIIMVSLSAFASHFRDSWSVVGYLAGCYRSVTKRPHKKGGSYT